MIIIYYREILRFFYECILHNTEKVAVDRESASGKGEPITILARTVVVSIVVYSFRNIF